MVLYVKDRTGRFPERPHYKPENLDQECESIISGFLLALHGELKFPIETEDIKKLIERDAEDLDCYADLSAHGADVEGVTEFRPGARPAVRIASALTESPYRENRLRTTLAHEYGHVHFHAHLFEMNRNQGGLFQSREPERIICKRDNMIGAAESDWMEWQAGYVCGALLMPATAARRIVGELRAERNLHGSISPSGRDADDLVDHLVREFRVSKEAARVRLVKLGSLGQPLAEALFD